MGAILCTSGRFYGADLYISNRAKQQYTGICHLRYVGVLPYRFGTAASKADTECQGKRYAANKQGGIRRQVCK